MIADGYPLEPALDFMRRLWRLDHALARLSARMERSLGVTAPQRLVLRCVGKFPGVSAGRLATLLHLDPSTISSAMRRLEERGLLDRQRDGRDRRRVVLGLTAAGRALVRPSPGTVEHAVEALLADVSVAEVGRFATLIDRMVDLVEAETPGRPARARRGAPAGRRPRAPRA